ncbi:hypothetical protein [Spirillospora sp. CA-128828]|uniref:hypothetical protein n=1 Tax=Spirillospora sp. CA-128828 TaxID=3240033 RepID=UPI003D8D70FD
MDDRPATGGVDAAPFIGLARKWNRRVPGNQKVFVAEPPPFEEFLGDPLPGEMLRWMEETAEAGYGLLLSW